MKLIRLQIFILASFVSFSIIAQNRFPVKKKNKYGFIDKAGQVKIEPIFEESFEFKNDFGIYIDSNLLISVIDTNGKVIKSYKENRPSWITKKSTNSNNYGPYHYFSNHLLAVYDTTSRKYGYINESGQWTIPPKFTHAIDFKEGLAAVGFWSNDPDIPYIHHSESAADFDKTVKWGFIDTTGELVIDTLFYDFIGFENGICWVQNKSVFEEYFIDKKGNKINPDTITDIQTLCWLKSLDKDFLYQKNGKCIGSIYNYKTNLYTARENFDGKSCNGLYGFVDYLNNWVIPPQYLNVRPFVNGLAGIMKKVTEGEFKWGFLDNKGDTIIPLQYDEISNFNSYGITVVCSSGKCGIINKKNEKLTELVFDYNYLYTPKYRDGLILLYKNEKQHYLNEKGKVIWKEE
tara:strand:+ start:818 stop:2029 length:1212 start_codon:yes stop_codon:yes gene_type:complete